MWVWRIVFIVVLFAVLMASPYVGQAYSVWLRAAVVGVLCGVIALLFARSGVLYRAR